MLLSWRYCKPVSVIPMEDIMKLEELKGLRVLKVPAQLGFLVCSWSFRLTSCCATDDQGLWAHTCY